MRIYSTILGFTANHSQKTEQQGYIDIENIHDDDVLDEQQSTKWLPDFEDVLAVLNITGDQSWYNSILLMKSSRVVKCRLTPNQILSRLPKQFMADYHRELIPIAKSLEIERHIPFVCGDFRLIPVGIRQNNNHSWVRLHPDYGEWRFEISNSYLNYPDMLPLKLPNSEISINNRISKCELLSAFFKIRGEQTAPTKMLGENHLSHFDALQIFQKAKNLYDSIISRKLLRDQ